MKNINKNITKENIAKVINDTIFDNKLEPCTVDIDSLGNIHFSGPNYYIVGGPGAAEDFDKAMKDSLNKSIKICDKCNNDCNLKCDDFLNITKHQGIQIDNPILPIKEDFDND